METLHDTQIRLLSHLNISDDSEIHLSRKHVCSLPSSGPARDSYVALSYFWGNNRSSVSCDGKNVEVSSNLAAALPHIRKRFPNQLLWTDSLCINQQDVEEKSHQVGMMGHIFASARTVIVWLGGDADNVADNLETMTVDMRGQKTDEEWRRTLIRQLSSMKWFYRAWCFQEIRLARNAVVLLGSRAIPWKEFIAKVQYLRNLEPHFSTTTIRSETRSYSRYGHVPKDRFFAVLDELNAGPTDDLAGLLLLTWYREASEKRDKVYSLLSSSLFDPVQQHIPIDYKIAWKSLCIRTARACMNTANNLKVLRISGMTQRWKSPTTGQWEPSELPHLLEHPSWAPDWWNPPQQTRAATTLTFDDRGCFSELDFCCPRTPPQQDLDDTSPFLVLQGILLGIINVGDPPIFFHGTTMVHPPPHCASAFTPAFLEKPKDKSTGRQTLRGVAKPEMPWFVNGVQNHLENDCFCVPFSERNSNRGLASSLSASKSVFSKPHSSQSGVSGFKFGHEFFPIHAYAPPKDKAESEWPAQVIATSVESGDWLVLLEGGGTPFILRPLKNLSGRIQDIQWLKASAWDRKAASRIPDNSGCFMLVGEASMCWDQLWPGQWDRYCKAGTFVLV